MVIPGSSSFAAIAIYHEVIVPIVTIEVHEIHGIIFSRWMEIIIDILILLQWGKRAVIKLNVRQVVHKVCHF
mgnify:CR=1 FL=1